VSARLGGGAVVQQFPPQVNGGLGRLGVGGRVAADDWWLAGGISAANVVAAYQPVGAASLAASYVNLANPGTYDAAPGVAPTWGAATGWIFNGTNQNLRVSVRAESGWAAIIRFSDAPTSPPSRGLFGQIATNARMAISPLGGTTPFFVDYYNGGLQLAVAPGLTGGVLGVSGNRAYRNGLQETGTLGNWTGTAFDIIAIGAWALSNTTVGVFQPCRVQAFALYNTTLTAPQVAAVSAAMAALT
jgi:hypothetical protein